MHLVDRVVHRPDQRGDRPAVERGEEGAAYLGQHAAGDVVRFMLALLDLGDVLEVRSPAVDQLGHRRGGGNERRPVRFEHAEEVALARKQALEPCEHRKKPLSAPLAKCDDSMTGFSPSARARRAPRGGLQLARAALIDGGRVVAVLVVALAQAEHAEQAEQSQDVP